MQKYGVNELRRMFLEFFESKDHLAMKSFSLVPHNDNSLLLINAGMAPLKPYFTGQEIPPRRRVCTCQKCIRTGDIENIGKTARHGTFFEMLGNFSFGDYFKTESLHWSWEFLTQVVGLDPDRLYPSIYLDDEEAFKIWNEEIGVPAERIFRFGREDNFWEHGAGPCGPCSEIYYDRGEKYGCGKPDCTVGCECDRYIEVWNNVFSQFENDGHGNYTELAQKNIDTGMGLERLAVVVQDVDSLFTIDTNKALLDRVCQLAGKEYQKDYETDVSLRIVTDHIKSCTFMISDGIMPSNEGRGYVLRRLIRRAFRFGRLMGMQEPFLYKTTLKVVEVMGEDYPELRARADFMARVTREEEERFSSTLDKGLAMLEEEMNALADKGEKIIPGETAFKLYDTYGFPLDIVNDVAEKRGFKADEAGFNEYMHQQKQRARAAWKGSGEKDIASRFQSLLEDGLKSEFFGYTALTGVGRVVALLDDDGLPVEALPSGSLGYVVTDQTPFYGASGGQCGDTGLLTAPAGSAKVLDTLKPSADLTVHHIEVDGGIDALLRSERF